VRQIGQDEADSHVAIRRRLRIGSDPIGRRSRLLQRTGRGLSSSVSYEALGNTDVSDQKIKMDKAPAADAV